ncbi:MAG: acyl carrier protein [Polyangiaceae bacterium]|nr:acyl carrier protein [Polyangiaceae bacterium]
MSVTRSEVEKQIERREALLDKVREILVEALHVQLAKEDIDPDVSLFGTGLGLDSVDAVELLVGLETHLGVKLPDQSLARMYMRTVNTLVEMVIDHGKPITTDAGASHG